MNENEALLLVDCVCSAWFALSNLATHMIYTRRPDVSIWFGAAYLHFTHMTENVR